MSQNLTVNKEAEIKKQRYLWICGSCCTHTCTCTCINKPQKYTGNSSNTNNYSTLREHECTYLIQRGQWGTISTIVLVTVHVKYFLPTDWEQATQDTFLLANLCVPILCAYAKFSSACIAIQATIPHVCSSEDHKLDHCPTMTAV